MPRYFFHVIDGTNLHDEEGAELPGIDVAQDQAIRMAGEILRDVGRRLFDGTKWRLEVADEQEHILFVLHVSAEERFPQFGVLLGLETGPEPSSARH